MLKKIRENVAPGHAAGSSLKTIECQIMDIADDIAYSTYDLEDGLKGGFVDPLMLLNMAFTDFELLQRVTDKVKKDCSEANKENVLDAIAKTFGLNRDGHIQQGDEQLTTTPIGAYNFASLLASNGYFRIALTSSLVDIFINNVSVAINDAHPALSTISMEPTIKLQVESLKHLNYEATIMSPRLKLVEFRGYEIVKTIFEELTKEGGYLLLPQDVKESYQRLRDSEGKMRLACDFVAGMTDRYAIEFFGRLKQGDQSIFKPF